MDSSLSVGAIVRAVASSSGCGKYSRFILVRRCWCFGLINQNKIGETKVFLIWEERLHIAITESDAFSDYAPLFDTECSWEVKNETLLLSWQTACRL